MAMQFRTIRNARDSEELAIRKMCAEFARCVERRMVSKLHAGQAGWDSMTAYTSRAAEEDLATAADFEKWVDVAVYAMILDNRVPQMVFKSAEEETCQSENCEELNPAQGKELCGGSSAGS